MESLTKNRTRMTKFDLEAFYPELITIFGLYLLPPQPTFAQKGLNPNGGGHNQPPHSSYRQRPPLLGLNALSMCLIGLNLLIFHKSHPHFALNLMTASSPTTSKTD